VARKAIEERMLNTLADSGDDFDADEDGYV
jgi:hypothetical protein